MKKENAIEVITRMIHSSKINHLVGETAIAIFDELFEENQINQSLVYKRFEAFELIVYDRTEVEIG